MTENEAIKELKAQIETAESIISYNTDFEPKHDNSVLKNKIKTAEMGISALEKQIPKKVVKQHEEPTDDEIKELIDLGFCGGDVIRCPNCNEYIVIDKLKYCMECGQRLDWSDAD